MSGSGGNHIGQEARARNAEVDVAVRFEEIPSLLAHLDYPKGSGMKSPSDPST